MSLLCLVVGFGRVHAEDLPKVWNPIWAGYEAQWGSDFEKVLTAVQDKHFDDARRQLNVLNDTLAKLNLLAQSTVKAQERETLLSLRRVIVDESRRAAGRRKFFSEHDQDILKVLLSELADLAGDTKRLKQAVSREQWRIWKNSFAINSGVFLTSGGVTSGGLAAFFATHHFRSVDFQTPTTLIVGALVGGLTTRAFWQSFPKFMKAANLVAPVVDDCRRSLTH